LAEPAPRGNTIVMRIGADAATAKRIADILAETFDTVAASAFERADGWTAEAHFNGDPDREKIAALVRAVAGEAAAGAIRFEPLAAKDWIATSLAGLAPVPAGPFVVHGAHDRARVAPNKIGIEIEAALAFGTGHHGTTQGCLAAIARIAKARRPKRILDIGTGTGVLAIAAARAFRRPVLASDIDADAVAIARANGAANRAGCYARVVRAAGLRAPAIRGQKFEFVLANILLPVLTRLAGPVRLASTPGATVVLSGLLAEQANAALAVWRAHGFQFRQRQTIEGWTTLTLTRARKKQSPARGRRLLR